VSTSLKCFIALLVVIGILYVLISPLPEVDATLSGKSFFSYFVLVTHAFLGLFLFAFSVRLFPVEWISNPRRDVLKMTCVRLC
jgi:hypothetical protein